MSWTEATIVRVIEETPLDRTLFLAVPPGRLPPTCVPGQHVVLRHPVERPPRDWYFSLSGMPAADGVMRVTVRRRGDEAHAIYDAPQGTGVLVSPPSGAFHIGSEPGEELVLCGAGSGVAPFRTYLDHRRQEARNEPVRLLHSAREPEELTFHAELSAWAADDETFEYVPRVTGHAAGWTGLRGRFDAPALAAAITAPARTRVFACGPRPYVESALAAAAACGVPPHRLLREG
ncbi:MAG: hypothetical protein O2894_12040 [Planctomycetota bacterium]|nr:hypothetical protein [Planctomycetota bacterium]